MALGGSCIWGKEYIAPARESIVSLHLQTRNEKYGKSPLMQTVKVGLCRSFGAILRGRLSCFMDLPYASMPLGFAQLKTIMAHFDQMGTTKDYWRIHCSFLQINFCKMLALSLWRPRDHYCCSTPTRVGATLR